MTDVAQLAGVSHQTVSRVLNDHPNVRPATRERVMSAIDSLGYRPNSAAKILVTGRSQALGVVSFDTTLYGPASTVFGLEQAARAAGYFVSIASLAGQDVDSVREAVDRLIAQSVAGIMIVAPLMSAEEAIAVVPASLPVVLVQGGPESGAPEVIVDHEEGARQAVEHLLALGHRTVWHIGGPEGWIESRTRKAGWHAALSFAGAHKPTVLPGDWSARSGYSAGQRLAAEPDVTAVFAANDQMSLGLLRALNEAGRRVPDDISVVGFDDIPEAAYLSPPLTTIRQDFTEVGRRSLDLILAQLDTGSRIDTKLLVPTEIVIRHSTAAPPLHPRGADSPDAKPSRIDEAPQVLTPRRG
jgi:DNA-binding LacI/PurR family transcriptional regulator